MVEEDDESWVGIKHLVDHAMLGALSANAQGLPKMIERKEQRL